MAASGKPSINRYRADSDVIRIEIPCDRNSQYLFPMDSFIEGSIKCSATPPKIFIQFLRECVLFTALM